MLLCQNPISYFHVCVFMHFQAKKEESSSSSSSEDEEVDEKKEKKKKKKAAKKEKKEKKKAEKVHKIDLGPYSQLFCPVICAFIQLYVRIFLVYVLFRFPHNFQ